jgi:hypothetical protein
MVWCDNVTECERVRVQVLVEGPLNNLKQSMVQFQKPKVSNTWDPSCYVSGLV